MPSVNGTIKRIVSDKGFGFIATDDGQEYLLPSISLQRDTVRGAA